MDESEMNELMVQPTIEALIAATTSEDGTQLGAAIQMVLATDEARLVPVAIGLARVAGPHAATVWFRLGQRINDGLSGMATPGPVGQADPADVSAYVKMVNLIYRHALDDDRQQEVYQQWAECDPPMRAAAIVELMSMAAMARHYDWEKK